MKKLYKASENRQTAKTGAETVRKRGRTSGKQQLLLVVVGQRGVR